MKRMFLIISLIITSCSQYPGGKLHNSERSYKHQEKHSVVIADSGLRLRDKPDQTGSQELTIIPFGAEFQPYYCIEVQGTDWAFGVYRNEQTNYLGYVAARYLEGGCEDT